MDYSKIKAKVNTWRKMEGNSDNRDDRIKMSYDYPTIVEGYIQGSHADDVVCGIQQNPGSRTMVVHLDRLVHKQETVRDERP
jgi:hypothetical protein